MSAKTLTTTFTGEPFQPVRLYYEVLSTSIVIARFQRLHCLEYDPPADRWCWYYTHEAKTLTFQRSYSALPKEVRPLVLGYFKGVGTAAVTLNLRSIDRALKAAEFFQAKMPQRAWRLSRVRLVNGLLAAPTSGQVPELALEDFLDVEDVKVQRDEAVERDISAIAAQHPDAASRTRAINHYLEQRMREPLPPVEEFSVDPSEADLEQFTMALQMRHVVAVQHWNGNTRFSRLDILQKLMGQEPSKLAIEL